MKNKMLLTVLISLLLAGPALAADTIRIGLMAPLTGAWASEGQDMKQIVELLADELNAAGGINGKQVRIITVDDGGDPRTAALAAHRLVHAANRGGYRHLRIRGDGSFPGDL
jgi:branched-chain amino acid transport system substrate-binding protein